MSVMRRGCPLVGSLPIVVLLLGLLVTLVAPKLAAPTGDIGGAEACLGDCDAGGRVTVDEIIRIINIELDQQNVDACPNNWPSTCQICLSPLLDVVENLMVGCPATHPPG